MTLPQERKIYGLTGEIGRDGILTQDLQILLDRKQHEATEAVLDHLGQRAFDGNFPIAAMATGIGKTRVEHEVIEKWRRRNPEAKILFIAGTKLTLVDQSSKALFDYQLQNINDNGGAFTGSENLEEDNNETENIEEALEITQKDLPFYRIGQFKDREADVRVATIQTLQSAHKRGILNPAEFDLVIVDEVHNIGTKQRVDVIKQFRNVIGFTATPHRHSGQFKKPEQYGFEVAYNLPLPEVQNLRLLPPLLGMQVDTTGLVEEIPTTPSGLIDYKKLEQILKKSPDLRPFIADKVAEIIKDGDKEYKTVIAVNFVWEAQELAQLLRVKGIKVGVAVNQQAAKQIHTEEIPAIGTIERYKLAQDNPKSIQVLISPYVTSEGFDAPFTEVLVWASPTDSDLRYTQYVGRLARRSEGKLFGLNLDFLYQTNQYGWSYNMGMWMKGSIKQLPSGLLYLGPEQDIAGLAELDVVKNMRRKGDLVEFSDLQKGQLEELKDTDLALTKDSLNFVFQASPQKSSRLAKQLKDRLEVDHPEYFADRRSRNMIVDVVTAEGRQSFINGMIDLGIRLRDQNIQDINDADLPLTTTYLPLIFIGRWSRSFPIAQQIKAELEPDHPEYFAKRGNGKYLVDVVTAAGRVAFIEAMLKEGIQLKDQNDDGVSEVYNTDLALSPTGLSKVFSGNKESKKLISTAKYIKDQLEIDHPEYFARRKSGGHIFDAVVIPEGRDAFIQAMIAAGIELKKK